MYQGKRGTSSIGGHCPRLNVRPELCDRNHKPDTLDHTGEREDLAMNMPQPIVRMPQQCPPPYLVIVTTHKDGSIAQADGHPSYCTYEENLTKKSASTQEKQRPRQGSALAPYYLYVATCTSTSMTIPTEVGQNVRHQRKLQS